MRTLFSDPFTVDLLFPSMLGPYPTRLMKLTESGEGAERELIWLTGLQMDVVGPEDETEESIEYECHTSLVWPNDEPEGTHRPYSTEDIFLNTLKPFASTGADVIASLENEAVVYSAEQVDEKAPQASCHAGSLPPGVPAKVPFIVEDKQGRKFTGHWVVKPGRHGTTVFKSTQRRRTDRVGLDAIESFASVDGVPLDKDHDYELVSVYDNPTQKDSDAMASIFLYYLDTEFQAPARAASGT